MAWPSRRVRRAYRAARPAPLRRFPIDRKTLLVGTALASTLLLGAIGHPTQAIAVTLTCAGDVGTGPTPIDHANDDPIICVNTEARTGGPYAIYLATPDSAPAADGQFISLDSRGTLTATYVGPVYGIYTATLGDFSPITIENRGNVRATSTGDEAFGIFADTYGDFSRIKIVNSGDVRVKADDLAYGIRTYTDGEDSRIAVRNSGDIAVTSSDLAAIGIQAGTSAPGAAIDIVNSGNIEAEGSLTAFGILARSACCDAPISIVNSGDITVASSLYSLPSAGIYAFTIGSDIAITNSGALAATAGDSEAFGITALSAYGDIGILNRGPITADTDGIYAASIFGDMAVVNEGKIDAGIHGIHVGAGLPSPGYGDVAITNAGSIEAGEIGILAIAGGFGFSPVGSGIAIVNRGPITAPSGIIATVAADGSDIAILNEGKITAKDVGIYAATGVSTYVPCGCSYGPVTFAPSGAGDNSPIFIANSGVIDPEIGIKAVALGANSPITIYNSGTILGNFAAIYAIGYSGTEIVNTGDISAGSNRAISVYGSGARILNAGSITGFVDLSYQGDRFINQAGGVFEAKRTSYFNAGSDLFRNQAGATVQTATELGAREAVQFEGLERFENAGLISMVDGAAGDSFTISNTPGDTDLAFVASGDSALAVDAFLGGPGSNSDTFTIEGNVSGTTTVAVNNTNFGPGVFNSTGIPVVFVTGETPNSNAFQLTQPIDTGFFDYDLFFVPTGSGFWELRSFPGAGAQLLPQLVTAAQDIWHQGSSTWFDRTADLRVLLAGGAAPTAYAPDGTYGAGAPQGTGITPAVWTRGAGAWLDRDDSASTSAYGRNYRFDLDRDLEVMDFQMGLDLGTRDLLSQGDVLVFGMLGGFVQADLDYDAIARQFDFSGGQVGAYATYLKGGLFVDTLLNAHLYELETATLGFPDSLDANTIGLRTDTGYRFGAFRGGPFLEPLATIEVLWADIDGFSLGGNTVSFDDEANVRGRLGLRAGTTMQAWEGTLMEPFVIGSLWGNLSGDTNQATLVSTGTSFQFQDELEDLWGEVSAGVNFFNPTAATTVFAKVDVSFGDDLSGIGGKAGMRVAW